MKHIDTWSISEPNLDGTGNVHVIVGHIQRGPAMSPSQAKEFVDLHHSDRVPFEAALDTFQTACGNFLQAQFEILLDTNDEATSRNYWALLLMMTDGLYAQLSAAQQSHFLKFKPMPGDTDYVEPSASAGR